MKILVGIITSLHQVAGILPSPTKAHKDDQGIVMEMLVDKCIYSASTLSASFIRIKRQCFCSLWCFFYCHLV